jgi:hypothetical protein
MDVVKLPPRMGPASRLPDLLAIRALEPGIRISLQNPGEGLQMHPGSLTFSVRGVSEQHRGRIGACRMSVIPNIGPQPALPGCPSPRA